MKCQLTYSFNEHDDIFVTQCDFNCADVLAAIEEAISYIEIEHGMGKSLSLQGFSILKLVEHE
ncbi:hypothetical protein ACSVDA_11875 [Cytobacillus sp. Hm23]